ncbi:hypothetical protein GCM10012275_05480 [Longimycelium tulufanense]|uniref:Uncharacterized protein n=1 Tax=Longimycelium tulufanense TaxID=907463 RepID=A0A8J3FT99_9PSEU|nr:hypothetical protein GCM10012275_05480 [Longimycelium tulufanense]
MLRRADSTTRCPDRGTARVSIQGLPGGGKGSVVTERGRRTSVRGETNASVLAALRGEDA